MVNINDSLAVKPKSKRIFYFDALRAMAIIAVIVIHVFSETMVLFKYGQLPFHSGGWLFEDVLGVCFRFGVDLFLMLALGKRLGYQDISGQASASYCNSIFVLGICAQLIAFNIHSSISGLLLAA